MWKTAMVIACAALGAATGRAQSPDGTADDDLALVRRAVEKEEGATASRPAPRDQARARRTDQARWLRVRIEERKGSKVKVNLPLALVRDLGEDLPVDWGCGHGHRPCRLKLAEVLDRLEGGQDLVEIQDEDSTVRIWIE